MQDDSQNVLKSDDSESSVNVGDDATNKFDKSEKCSDNDEESNNEETDELIYVPNPIKWDEKDIVTWLNWLTKKFKCDPKLEASRFPSDSQELLKFSKADFWVCAGSGENGNYAAKHYGYLLRNATGNADPSLFTDTEPGNFSSFLINRQINFLPTFHRDKVLWEIKAVDV